MQRRLASRTMTDTGLQDRFHKCGEHEAMPRRDLHVGLVAGRFQECLTFGTQRDSACLVRLCGEAFARGPALGIDVVVAFSQMTAHIVSRVWLI